MRAAAYGNGFGAQGAGFAGAQKFDGRGKAHHAGQLAGIGRCTEGHVGQGKDGPAVGKAHAVAVVRGKGHGDHGVFRRGAFNVHLEQTHEFVVFCHIVFHTQFSSRKARAAK